MRRYASLRGRREFSIVLRRGRAASSKDLIVFTLAPQRSRVVRAHDGLTKVGIVITKKVGSAVERNRLRRRCKAILDGAAIGNQPLWYVVQFRPSAAALSFSQLREQLASALAKGDQTAGQARRGREGKRP